MTSTYYQAFVIPAKTWFFTATLRSYEHLAFDRTKDPATGLFEFFVSPDDAARFEKIMQVYVDMGIVSGFTKVT